MSSEPDFEINFEHPLDHFLLGVIILVVTGVCYLVAISIEFSHLVKIGYVVGFVLAAYLVGRGAHIVGARLWTWTQRGE